MANNIRKLVLSATEAGPLTPPAIRTRWLRLTVIRGGLGLARTTPDAAAKLILVRDSQEAPAMPATVTLAIPNDKPPMDLLRWVWLAERPGTEVQVEYRETKDAG